MNVGKIHQTLKLKDKNPINLTTIVIVNFILTIQVILPEELSLSKMTKKKLIVVLYK